MDTGQGRDALRDCERQLRKLVAQAADAGDYAAVMQLTDWAKAVSHLIAESQAMPVSRGQETELPKRLAARGGFPRFVRHGEELIKYGWSKSKRREYQHRAPREMAFQLVERLATSGSKTKVKPATDFVFNGAIDGDSPTYQFYVCLAWLRSVGLVAQHGRQGYTVPEPSKLKSAANTAWAALKEE